jgi:hypothetical protein
MARTCSCMARSSQNQIQNFTDLLIRPDKFITTVVPNRCMSCNWQTYFQDLTDLRTGPDGCKTRASPINGQGMTDAWPTPGRFIDMFWQTHGQDLTDAGPVPAIALGRAWQMHDPHLTPALSGLHRCRTLNIPGFPSYPMFSLCPGLPGCRYVPSCSRFHAAKGFHDTQKSPGAHSPWSHADHW